MININLIAERRARKLREMTILRMGTLGVISLAVLLVLGNMYFGLVHLSAKNELSQIRHERKALEPQYQEWSQVQEEITRQRPVVMLLEQVQMSEGAWMTILSDLSRITPREVVITSLNSSADGEKFALRISGSALDEDTVAGFMLALSQQTRWAEKPELKTFSNKGKAEAKSVQFDLLVPVRDMVGGNL